MNRDIKFRAWYKTGKKMFKVGQLTYEPKDKEFIGMSIPYQPDFILMQYTGLKDKNGVEIYEGDIIDIHQTVNGFNQFVIQYDDYKFSARYYNQETKQILGWYQYDLDELFEINETEKEIEVIGNIYENEVD